MLTLKRLLLAISMGCLIANANAAPMDDARTAYNKGDYKEALEIWRPLADQGDVDAQYNIGLMYEVTQNYKEAVKWYRLAAVQEDAVAQYNIGAMYHNGQGVTKDYIRAHMWYNLSSLSGHANGTKDRDLLAKEMTPQQIEKAQNMARECEAKDFKEC